MGFWSTLVHTAVQATHWVANNSGSIASAASTIAKIAGSVALTEEEIEAEGDNILPRLKADIGKAEKTLLAAAVAQFPQPIVPSGYNLRIVDLPALWPTPTGTTAKDPKVIPEIAMDINRILACERVPNVLGKSAPTDVGDTIANQLFVSPDNSKTLNDGNLFYNPVEINSGTPSIPIITGGMVFYPIPLGNPGSHAAWHSHLRLYYLYSSDDEKAIQAEKRALAIKQRPGKISPGDSYNSATLSVQWTGARSVAQIMSAAVQKMVDNSSGDIEIMKPAVIDGTRFKYQFKTGTDMGPAEVAAALSVALGNVMPPATPDHPLPRMPTIKVSNLQTYIS